MNGGVTFVLVAVCIAVVAAGVGRLVVRRVVDERRSVRDYQQTLQTLRHLSDRSDSAGVGPPDGDSVETGLVVDPVRARRPVAGQRRPVGSAVHPSPEDPITAAGSRASAGDEPAALSKEPASSPKRPAMSTDGPAVSPKEPVPVASARGLAPAGAGTPGDSSTRRRSDHSDEATAAVFVFDDLAPPRRTEQAGLSAATAVDDAFGGRGASFEAGRQSDRGSGRSKPVNRPLRLATGAVAVLLVVAAAVTVVTSSRHAPRSSAAAGGVTAGASSGKSAPANSGGSARSGGGRSGSTGGRQRSGSKSTKVATPSIVQPTAVTLYDATVAAPASTYQVAVSVTGNCWVEGEETTTSTDVWSGVLTAGEQHSFDFDGPVLLRIGAADATVTLNGTPVALPSGYQAPYNLTFAPS